jgi:hypothetical protein
MKASRMWSARFRSSCAAVALRESAFESEEVPTLNIEPPRSKHKKTRRRFA